MPQIGEEVAERKEIAQYLLSRGIDEVDLDLVPDLAALPAQTILTAALNLQFPPGLGPVPEPPDATTPPSRALPRSDVLVVTWTIDEQNALADVLTPGFGRKAWPRYHRGFKARYRGRIRPGAPARNAERLGSWMRTRIGEKSVLCFKSELHLNQDGIRNAHGPGIATLPVKDLWRQIIEEVHPKVVLTTGTAGGVARDDDLGDVVVTRGAKFRLSNEFKNAPYAGKSYQSEWEVPTSQFVKAVELMQLFANKLSEPRFLPPTTRHQGRAFEAPTYTPDIKLDGSDGMQRYHPILTTDFFEFGTSMNGLEREGCGVEMGDAVLGLVASEMNDPPHWAVVRNLSDPQINGELDRRLQVNYAVWYYQEYGYWTSVMSALTVWAIIAGLESRPS